MSSDQGRGYLGLTSEDSSSADQPAGLYPTAGTAASGFLKLIFGRDSSSTLTTGH